MAIVSVQYRDTKRTIAADGQRRFELMWKIVAPPDKFHPPPRNQVVIVTTQVRDSHWPRMTRRTKS